MRNRREKDGKEEMEGRTLITCGIIGRREKEEKREEREAREEDYGVGYRGVGE